MKRFFATALMAAGGVFVVPLALAQSCTGFSGTINTAAGSLAGNTCQASSTLADTCHGSSALNGAGVAIYEVTTGATSNYTFTVTADGGATTPDFLPFLAYIGSPCDSNTNCIGTGVPTAADDGEVSVGPYTEADTPASGNSYFVIVADIAADTPGCGGFTLTWGPSLPVEIQSFSVN